MSGAVWDISDINKNKLSLCSQETCIQLGEAGVNTYSQKNI